MEPEPEPVPAVKARPVPHRGVPVLLPPVPRKSTQTAPFSFETRDKLLLEKKEDKIQKKADKMFFDRDKIRWVSWDSGIDSVKAVAGEEALNRMLTKKKESDPDERTPVKIHYPTTKSRVFCTVD